ncbi:B12-binding domain-containing radical SAM protein [Patescibacteria group bacterium]|nr:B12-binding domain-containing radical SAM protein [Patescibacteria group bacterium]MBU2579494.1 B12-binding domain-containing radical SAM protein [Patescibacteria group bacterium]
MKIILVSPSFNVHTIAPPLGLGYIASVLLDNGHQVEILDPSRKKLSLDDVAEIIISANPDVLGLSILTSRYNASKELIAKVKEKSPQIKTIVGGAHISALPEISVKDIKADYGAIGEGEYILLELLEHLQGKRKLEDILGLVYWQNEIIKINPRRPNIENLDSIPFPAWHLMDPREYPPMPHQFFFKKYPVAPIMTTRGCPHLCSFCAAESIWGRKYRTRSVKNIVDEIELLVTKYGVKEIHIEDDNFTLIKKHALDVCNEIIRRKLNIVWKCPNGVRADSLDEELLAKMKESGCYQLAFGIESGNQEILNSVNKRLDLKIIPGAVKRAKAAGLEVHGFFMIGFPGETYQTAMDTIKFSRSIGLDVANYATLAYLPGSAVFKEWIKNKKTESMDWGSFNYYTPQDTVGLTADQLKKIQRKALLRFYFSPKVLISHLLKLKLKQIPYLPRAIFDYLIGN